MAGVGAAVVETQEAGVAALGAVAGAVARVLERNLRLFGRDQGLVTALLAGVGVVAVAALGRKSRTSPNHAHRHRQRPDDHPAPQTMHRPNLPGATPRR